MGPYWGEQVGWGLKIKPKFSDDTLENMRTRSELVVLVVKPALQTKITFSSKKNIGFEWNRKNPPCSLERSRQSRCPSLECRALSFVSLSPSSQRLPKPLWRLCWFQASLILPFQHFCNGTCGHDDCWNPSRWIESGERLKSDCPLFVSCQLGNLTSLHWASKSAIRCKCFFFCIESLKKSCTSLSFYSASLM